MKTTSIQSANRQRPLSTARQKASELNARAKALILSSPAEAFQLARQAFDIANAAGDREEVFHSLHTWFKYYRFTDDTVRAWEVLADLEQVAQTLDDWAYTKHTLYAKAILLYKSRRLPEARDTFQTMITQARAHNAPVTSATIGLAAVYADTGMYDHALGLLFQALEMAREKKEQENTASCYSSIATLYSLLGHYDTARKFLQQALEMNVAAKDTINEIHNLLTLGVMTAENLHHYDEALTYFNRAVPLARTCGQRRALTSILLYSGIVFSRVGQIDKALDYIREAEDIARHIDVPDIMVEILRAIGNIYILTGRAADALPIMTEALELATDIQHHFHLTKIHLSLAEAYEQTGQIAESLHHYRQHMDMYKSYIGTAVQHKIAQLHLEYELRRTEEEQQYRQQHTGRLQLESEHMKRQLVEINLHQVQQREALLKCRAEIERLAGSAKGREKSRVRELLKHIDRSLESSNGWAHFEQQFQEVYNTFTAKVSERFPGLSPTELKICCLLRLNLSSKDIADLLCISLHTLNTHRYHIRRKLALSRNSNLTAFLLAL